MVVNKLLSFLTLIFIFICRAQNENYDVVVQYDSTLMSNKIYSTLVGGKDKSVFFYSKMEEESIDNVFKSGKININPYYLFIFDSYSKKMYKSFSYAAQIALNKGGLSLDDYPDMKWNLKNETKEILGYKCRKAITSFRGREYEVWYTIDLPSNYFPWKFSGLPGMILSFSDKEKTFAGNAISITQNKKVSKEFIERIENFFLTHKDSAISYKQEIEYENKWLENNRNKEIANLPLGTNYIDTPIRSLLAEKSFEWEETKKP